MRAWVTVGILSLQANLSLAADLPDAVTPSDFFPLDPEVVMLGRDLFFDPVLSGNRNIACATCHHPSLASGDGVSLGLGEGGRDLGLNRRLDMATAPSHRIPRNAPALFNLGAREFGVMFHDGRVQTDKDAPFGIRMPDRAALERPVPSALAAQAMMPVTSAEEMAGHPGENLIADLARDQRFQGAGGVWDVLCKRVEAIPGYSTRFARIIGPDRSLHFTDVARALAEFIAFEFRATATPFDAYLAGDATALDAAQRHGMDLFYGPANCASCHSGTFQTDHGFHAIGVPQLGPGKVADSAYDYGRGAVSGDDPDRYRFRTPSLRNVAKTAPYGHSGAFATLEGIVRHHLDPIRSLASYDPAEAVLPDLGGDTGDWAVLHDQEELIRIAAAVEITPVTLSDTQVADILAFLDALTDPRATTGRLGAPDSVPSGLPMDMIAR
ncbi:cytochrome-c peroxidase [Pseudooceanicola aestuarii]|uniref:cytochrome-c peroxidase n=1 Tax=Pseudooceanicola aestuarii TaxID=2697319 RepID=UPI0013D48BF1|nr:cytochrome c peroxidase [Pseudooceanicola aestuarii]